MSEIAPVSSSSNLTTTHTADVATAPDPARVAKIRDAISLTNRSQLLSFGDDAQRGVASFADQILRSTLNKDSGAVGDLISDMLVKVNRLDPESLKEASLIEKLWGGVKAKVLRFKEEFSDLASQVDRIALELERQQDRLKRDIAMMDGLFDKNLAQLRDLEAHILAGGEALAEARTKLLPQLEAKAASSGADASGQMAAQKLSDLRQAVDRLDRKLHDLKLSRVIAMQSLPQIRLVQNGDAMLVEKLQTSVSSTIPTWKNQMTIALALHRQDEALKLQREVSETTNEMLRRNADQLRTGAVGIERETQRGIVDVETLAHVNRQFAETLNEVLAIQRDGRAKREAAETELKRIEAELKDTLIEAREAR